MVALYPPSKYFTAMRIVKFLIVSSVIGTLSIFGSTLMLHRERRGLTASLTLEHEAVDETPAVPEGPVEESMSVVYGGDDAFSYDSWYASDDELSIIDGAGNSTDNDTENLFYFTSYTTVEYDDDAAELASVPLLPTWADDIHL